jgi:3-oxoacyl-[acyl-carrier-protein] synthase-1
LITAGIRISALGMTCCVGPSVVSAAAAVRAGLARRSPHAGFATYDEDELEAPLVVSAAWAPPGSFVHTGAWIRLADAAVRDLLGGAGSEAGAFDFSRCSMIFLVPEIDPERFAWTDDDPHKLKSSTAELLSRLCGVDFGRGIEVAALDRGGFAHALERARERIARDGAARILVVAADSWLDATSIAWLDGDSRLKSDESPTGLCPGEAGAAVLLEAAGVEAPTGGAVVLDSAYLPNEEPVDADDLAPWRMREAPNTGRRLAEAIERVLRASGRGPAFRGDVYLDLNGEEWRAAAWGHAQTHLLSLVDFDRTRVHAPATSLGDVGAAAGVAGMCLAARSFARGYSLTGTALVAAVSERGSVGAALLSGAA